MFRPDAPAIDSYVESMQKLRGTLLATQQKLGLAGATVLVFALAQGLFWAGVAATLLMGLGTAITVSAIAIIAVSAKGLAARIAAGDLALRVETRPDRHHLHPRQHQFCRPSGPCLFDNPPVIG